VPAVFKNLTFDPLKDLVPVGPIQSVPIVLTVAPKTPANTYKEFVELTKRGQVSVASAAAARQTTSRSSC
jgi:tripartite-type tricarboxylate transporter receptor subunit TctC